MTITDAAFAAALCLVIAGVALVYVPAAFIVAGVLVASLAVALDRGGDKS